MQNSELWVFGYGSLLYEPERPDELVDVVPGRVEGLRRALNKRSVARGCAAAESAWAGIEVPPAFFTGDRVCSLALGTAPGGTLDGGLLRYADAAVLADLDRREGYRAGGEARSNGYLRTTVEVRTARGVHRAVTWVSNPTGAFHVELAPADVARVLLRATPRDPSGRARGIRYVEEVVAALRGLGAVDPYLDEVLRLAAHERSL